MPHLGLQHALSWSVFIRRGSYERRAGSQWTPPFLTSPKWLGDDHRSHHVRMDGAVVGELAGLREGRASRPALIKVARVERAVVGGRGVRRLVLVRPSDLGAYRDLDGVGVEGELH